MGSLGDTSSNLFKYRLLATIILVVCVSAFLLFAICGFTILFCTPGGISNYYADKIKIVDSTEAISSTKYDRLSSDIKDSISKSNNIEEDFVIRVMATKLIGRVSWLLIQYGDKYLDVYTISIEDGIVYSESGINETVFPINFKNSDMASPRKYLGVEVGKYAKAIMDYTGGIFGTEVTDILEYNCCYVFRTETANSYEYYKVDKETLEVIILDKEEQDDFMNQSFVN